MSVTGSNSLSGGPTTTSTMEKPEDDPSVSTEDERSSTPADEGPKKVSADEFYTKADLEAMGLKSNVAEYLIQDHAHNPGAESPEVKGDALLQLERSGHLSIAQGVEGDEITVPVIARDGYSVFEILQNTNLTPDQAVGLVIQSDNFIVSEQDLQAAVDEDGNLNKSGKRAAGDPEFSGNGISDKVLNDSLDSDQQFNSAELQSMGLSAEIADYLTAKGPITGLDIKTLVMNGELKAAKVNDQIELRPVGSSGEFPPEGVGVIGLIDMGLSKEEAQWLIDVHGGSEGKISKINFDSSVTKGEDGSLSLNEEAQVAFQARSADEASLTADGADLSDLIALGLSSSQADFLIVEHESEKGSGKITAEKLEELKTSGFLIPDPDSTEPPRYMLGGEQGLPADQAQQQARSAAGNKGPDEPVLEIGPDGTGNFFVAGSENGGKASKLDTQQSVIFSKTKNEEGQPVGELAPNNGNAQGHFDQATLVSLGFTEAQVSALFADKGNPSLLTMTELRDAVARDVGGSSAVAQVSGQAIIMRQEGEPPMNSEESFDDPFAPTQQDAQWLNQEYGGGDGLTESELATALHEGAVQIVNGEVKMTAHGKAQAHAEFGATSDSSLAEQQSLLRNAVRSMTENQTGTERVLDERALMSMHNGNLKPADARLILQTYGDGQTVSQDQLWQAIESGELILSEIPGESETDQPSYNLKITPKGYANMADAILSDPNHPLTIQTNGVLSYPEASGATEITAEQLQQNHGLSPEDADALVSAHDQDGSGSLNAREMLSAIMGKSVTLDENNKITQVNISTSSDSIVGPYTYDKLVKKINSDNPPAEDIAKMIMLEHRIDPSNKNAQVTDQQIEDWLRQNPIMSEDANGKLSVIEPENQAAPDEVFNTLTGGNSGHFFAGFSRTSVVGGHLTDNSNLSFGEARGLTNLMVEKYGMGEKDGHKDRNRRFTREEVTKLVQDGILKLDENGKVGLTEKGKLEVKAHNAAQTTKFFDTAEKNGDTETLADGTRMVKKGVLENDDTYRQSDGEHWLSRTMRKAGFDPSAIDKRGAMTTGMYWAAEQGVVRFENSDQDGGSFQFEVNDRDYGG